MDRLGGIKSTLEVAGCISGDQARWLIERVETLQRHNKRLKSLLDWVAEDPLRARDGVDALERAWEQRKAS